MPGGAAYGVVGLTGRRGLLDVGSESHIDPEALVVDLPPLIDQGNDAELTDGQLILADRRIWTQRLQ